MHRWSFWWKGILCVVVAIMVLVPISAIYFSKDITQDDMLKFEGYLETDYVPQGRAKKNYTKKGLSKSTIEQYMSHIKRFYKYYFNKDEYKKGKRFQKTISYPDNVSWISSSTSNY